MSTFVVTVMSSIAAGPEGLSLCPGRAGIADRTHPHGGKRARHHVYLTLRVSDPKTHPGTAVTLST
jgi:hypothetical protein